MTYLRPNNRGNRTRPIFFAGAAFVVFIGLIQFIFPHFFSALATSVAVPFWRTEFSIESGSLASPENLLAQNEELRRHLLEADVKMRSVRALELENSELKSYLGRSTTTDYLLAAVLKRPPFAPYDVLVIDIGSEQGVVLGQKVYAPGDVLVGYVIDVLGQTSKVKLLSSPGEQYEILVAEAGTPAVAHGRGGGQYLAELPSDVLVEDGDLIFSPSLGDGPFGVVTAVVKDPTQPFETILFAPPVNVYGLRWVLVSKKKPE